MAKKSKSKLLDGQGSIVLPDANRAIEDIYEEIRDVYQTDDRPWVIGYSGGKDSSTTLQLIWYALSKLPKSKLKKPNILRENKIIITPAAILYSLEKNNKIFPIAEAAAPSEMKIAEKPQQNRIVLKSTTLLSLSISFKFFPVM